MQTLRGSFQPLRGSFQTSSRDIENKLIPPYNTDSLSLLRGDSASKAPMDDPRPEDFFNDYSKVKRQNDDFVFPTVFDVIRSAGGLTRSSDLKNIEIVRGKIDDIKPIDANARGRLIKGPLFASVIV